MTKAEVKLYFHKRNIQNKKEQISISSRDCSCFGLFYERGMDSFKNIFLETMKNNSELRTIQVIDQIKVKHTCHGVEHKIISPSLSIKY